MAKKRAKKVRKAKPTKKRKPAKKYSFNPDSMFVRSLKRHGDPASYALHIVALPFLVLGLISHKIDSLVIGLFFVAAGGLYAWMGRDRIQKIWITLYKSNVNKWFSFLGMILVAIGLWAADLTVIVIGITAYLFGLLYAWLTRKQDWMYY